MKPYFEKVLAQIIDDEPRYIAEKGNEFSCKELRNYPRFLYKYRDCTELHNFDMIRNEYLWADIPAKFTDPQDALVNLKLPSELPAIQKWLFDHIGEILYYQIPPLGMASHKNGQTLKNYISAQENFKDASGRYSAKKAKRLMTVELGKVNQVHRKEIERVYDELESPEFERKLTNAIQESLGNIINALRKKNLICCLTSRKENRHMWEDYAAKYSGFAIEYDLSKAVNSTECVAALLRIFPVSYYRRMPKVPLLPFIEYEFYQALYQKKIDISDARKKLYKQLLVKGYDYRTEEEWRIVSTQNRIPFPVVSAVYAGYQISDENLQKLKDICVEKAIPLYKQKFRSIDGEMVFERVS